MPSHLSSIPSSNISSLLLDYFEANLKDFVILSINISICKIPLIKIAMVLLSHLKKLQYILKYHFMWIGLVRFRGLIKFRFLFLFLFSGEQDYFPGDILDQEAHNVWLSVL